MDLIARPRWPLDRVRSTDDRVRQKGGQSMIGIVGAGAFGTALAVALGREGRDVQLWARDAAHIAEITRSGTNEARLPGVMLPKTVSVTSEIADLAGAEVVLLSLPMQALRGFLVGKPFAERPALVACCKGIDLTTLKGPTALIAAACPRSPFAILTGPSFAADIARGLPTALTLACAERRERCSICSRRRRCGFTAPPM